MHKFSPLQREHRVHSTGKKRRSSAQHRKEKKIKSYLKGLETSADKPYRNDCMSGRTDANERVRRGDLPRDVVSCIEVEGESGKLRVLFKAVTASDRRILDRIQAH